MPNPTITGPLGPIDAANYTTWNARPSFYPGPYVNGSDWFYIWSPSPNGDSTGESSGWTYNGPGQIWKSSDHGATWAMVFDITASLPLPTDCFLWDWQGNVGACPGPVGHIYFTAAAVSIPTNTLFLCDYDMGANTATVVSAPYDNGGNPSSPWATVFVAWDQSSGKTYVVFGDHGGSVFCFTLAVWDGANWTGPVNLTPEATWPAGSIKAQYLGNGLAADGTLYTSYCLGDKPCSFGPMGSFGSFVRSYASGVLSAAVPLNDPPGNVNAPWPYGGRIQIADGIVFVPVAAVLDPPLGVGTGFWETVPVVYAGTHPNPASFAVTDLGGQLAQNIQGGIIAAKLRVFWAETFTRDGSTPLDAIYYSEWNGSVWGAPILLHDELANPSFPALGALQWMFSLSVPVDLDSTDMGIMVGLQYPVPLDQSVIYYATQFQFDAAAPPPPPPPVRRLPPPAFSSGKKQMPHIGDPPRCKVNSFDLCLQLLAAKEAAIEKQTCQPRFPSARHPWTAPPAGSTRFSKTATIAAPDPASGDVLVAEVDVPLGYDAAFRAIAHYSTGAWSQGSGDLVFRYKTGRVWARGLGNVTLQLGSQARPWPLLGAVRVRSLSKIRVYARNTNAAAIPPGQDRIVCRLEGWFLPHV